MNCPIPFSATDVPSSRALITLTGDRRPLELSTPGLHMTRGPFDNDSFAIPSGMRTRKVMSCSRPLTSADLRAGLPPLR